MTTNTCSHDTIYFIVVNSILIGAKCTQCSKTWNIEEIAFALVESDKLYSPQKEHVQ